jgi:cytochrome c peroxidase
MPAAPLTGAAGSSRLKKSKAILQINLASVAALTAAALFVLLATIEPLLTEVRAERERTTPLGLPPLPLPPADPSVAALGKKLFFERRLSINDTMSCGMCHIEAQAFASNDLATSVGMEGKSLRRNAPSLLNVAYEKQLFRDGREDSLETQAWLPILTHDEMAAPSVGWALAKLRSLPDYRVLFEKTFPGRGITMDTLGASIAAYERTLLSGNSPFDRWHFGGDTDALSVSEQRGFELFTGKAGCAACHQIGPDSALFTDGKFHDTGRGYAKTMGIEPEGFDVRLAAGDFVRPHRKDVESFTSPIANDLGRFEVTRDPKDRWAFKTPGLRSVARTGPYMHDGSLTSLKDVVDYYARGGDYSPNKSELIKQLDLSDEEKRDLVSFLESLTGDTVTNGRADKYAAESFE